MYVVRGVEYRVRNDITALPRRRQKGGLAGGLDYRLRPFFLCISAHRPLG